ncbi:hypothetical protein ACE02U_21160 [Shewanella xiamenensis]
MTQAFVLLCFCAFVLLARVKDEHKQVDEAVNKTSKTKKPAYSAGFIV